MYKLSILSHLAAVSDWANTHGAKVNLDVGNFHLQVSARGQTCDLTPQFVNFTNGRLSYRKAHGPDVTGFAGWLPYYNKRWELAIDKLLFKRYCAAGGLRVPRLFRSATEVDADVLIKRSVS